MKLLKYFKPDEPIHNTIDGTTLFLKQGSDWILSRFAIVAWFDNDYNIRWVHDSKITEYIFNGENMVPLEISKQLEQHVVNGNATTIEEILTIIQKRSNADFATTIDGNLIVLAYTMAGNGL